MAQWSKLWELPKAQREEALKVARFTPSSRSGNKAKQNPAHQPFKPKKD